MKRKVYDLEDRLINFGVIIIEAAESMNKKRYAGLYLSKQLIRSGTSPGIHYGEAQAAESRKDFIHKMKIILKELRETRGNLRMSYRVNLFQSSRDIEGVIAECTELIAIFVKSIQTAERNGRTEKKGKVKPINGRTEKLKNR
ncbi:four helix bundle protein [Rhodohalobacter sp.]|uniref:four helix bundle protein n=1 Tax=Rhodohalobacter sp. TaxID=1974210 RepID=UPI002ACDCAC4|nr:four helix bundle protein [Rhodohalobacter sp.]MDZ7755605.1 four helix bundle protein [Rhodohalobacter sp.]